MSFNYSTFNGFRFNTYEKRVVNTSALISDLFKFGNIGLHHIDGSNDYIQVIRDRLPIPARIFNTTKNPRTNGKKIINSSWDERKIYLDIEVCKPTEQELDEAIDTLKTVLSEEEGELQMYINGAYRKFYATLTNQAFGNREPYPRNVETIELEFTCYDQPFGEDLNFSYRNTNNYTASVYSDTIVNNGSVEVPLYLKMYFTDANAITSILIENETNGQQIEITDAPSDADILIVDSIDVSVTLQSTAIRYTGNFIYLNRGSNKIKITTTSTAHDFNLNLKWKNYYL